MMVKPLMFATALGLASLAGCSEGLPLSKVTGKVTYQGEPVKYAAVEFKPVGDGKGSLGWTDEQGEYVMNYSLSQPGVLIGPSLVSLRTYAHEGERAVPVPAAYTDPSEVEFEVKPGSNRFDIEL